jgi:hypothetical protein
MNDMTTSTITHDGFRLRVSDHSLGRNLPQRLGRILWLPMLLMAVMAFPAAAILGAVRSATIVDGRDPATIAALGQYTTAVAFLGFASVFAAISFAIARILGEFREGGGRVQEAAGDRVETPVMPGTAKLFIALMAMAMMTLVATVVGHAALGVGLGGGTVDASDAARWSLWLESARRAGVALYLFAIGLGLASIVTILRFQIVRIRTLGRASVGA